VIADILSVVFGIALIAYALSDLFQSVIVPRAVGRRWRLTFIVWRNMWRMWPGLAWTLYKTNEDGREDFLAMFAPFTLIVLLVAWTATLIAGYAFIFWGLRAGLTPAVHTLGQAAYYSGITMLTVGFGDIVGKTSGPRFFSLVAAASGFATFSIATAYLFLLFASFQTREAFVVTVGARAGEPPSGVNLLAIAGYSDTRDDLSRLMIDAQKWIAAVMESHLAYPALAFFRSSHDYESWIGTLGTLLDAATLLMTVVDDGHSGQARLFYNLGRHATGDLSRYFRLQPPYDTAGIERQEFESACDRLAKAGYELRDRDESWERFSSLRSTYAGQLNAMAEFFQIPPLQWIGDRGTVKAH
jgi:hypothetical protein